MFYSPHGNMKERSLPGRTLYVTLMVADDITEKENSNCMIRVRSISKASCLLKI